MEFQVFAQQRAEARTREMPDTWLQKSVAELIQEAREELADAENYLRWALIQLGKPDAAQELCLRNAREHIVNAYGWLRPDLPTW